MPHATSVAGTLLALSAALAALFLVWYARRIEQRSHELRRAQHRMIADIAHNLQTPLAVLGGKVERVEQNLLHDGQTTGLRQSVDTLTRFIQDLLVYTCLEEELGIQKELFSLTNLVNNVYEEILDIAEAEDILVTVEARSGINIYGSRVHVQNALMNLVCNAIKYMGTSSVRHICLSLDTSGGQALISVTDTGMGIPGHDLPHIFERFYRGTNRTYGSIRGTGLGLSMVEKIIKEHGGSIAVASTIGKGSTFTVILPEAARGRLRNQ